MLTRRRFLAASALSSAAILACLQARAQARFATPLPIPRLLDARGSEAPIPLMLARGTHSYRQGQSVSATGYSAPVLGPTIRVARGQRLAMTVENRTDRTTSVHWHGLIIPSVVDGGPHNMIAPDGAWSPVLPIDQPETTAWFHPHPHGDTARQVYAGAAGLLLIDDGTSERLGLPRTYGVDDLPLILQDRWFDRTGAPVYDPSPMDIMAGFRGETVIVNGVVAPVAKVPAGVVRLRLLNAANARIFDLQFSDRRLFHVIASDGGYLAAPVPMRRLVIAPGERYEVLVDFSDGAAVVLETGPDDNRPMMGMMTGGAPPLLDGGQLIRFAVDRSRPASASMPSALVPVRRLDSERVVARRQFLLNDMMMAGMMGGRGRGGLGGMGSMMAINGRPFDMARIDVETRLGTLELWHIASQSMAHPFHVHGTQFQILSLDGRSPPSHLQGWKDTVLVRREAQILVPLTQPAPRSHPFMYHCHILEHEDAGMMGQFVCV
ncbi:MAG TPA: multicopper oxidase domain-containing protein [Xanthobacteraceae bacterium]|nr:multicopper oxidase domain-containing protein [Xanthobacteraceae bacterium]